MSRGLSVLAISTLKPFCSMGVITIKMISMTSMMSAIGTTLMSGIKSGALGL